MIDKSKREVNRAKKKRKKFGSLPPITKFFVPVPEACLKTKPKYILKPSGVCLTRVPSRASEIFMNLVTHGTPGLWVAASSPEKLRERYRLRQTPVLYVTPKRVPNEITSTPRRPKKILGIISGYLARTQRSVVLIDCLGEIALAVGFEKAMDFLKKMTGLCSQNNSSLIVQIDPGRFTKEQSMAIREQIAS